MLSTSLFVVIFTVFAVVTGLDEFDSWKAKFDKFYWTSKNEDAAREQFNKTLAYVTSYNTFFGTKTGFQMVLNEYSDLTEDQVGEISNGVKSVYTMVPLKVAAEPLIYGSYDSQFEDWKSDQDRDYENRTEEIDRYGKFRNWRSAINRHNADPVRSYEMGLNQFSDMADEEMRQFLISAESEENSPGNQPFPLVKAGFVMEPATTEEPTDLYCDDDNSSSVIIIPKVGSMPGSVDWRAMLGPSEDQGRCGSCYTFAAVGSIICRKNAKLFKAGKEDKIDKTWLSTQQIVDCSDNSGCLGGSSSRTFNYVGNVGGLNKASGYIYLGEAGECRFNANDRNTPLKPPFYRQVDQDEDALVEALQAGCLYVSISVENTFMKYKSGVYRPRGNCDETSRHAMVIVGYTDKYWIVRNSWGAKWGENGHVFFDRSAKNMCGMLTRLTYPIVA